MTASPRLGMTDLEQSDTDPHTSVNENDRMLEQMGNRAICTDRLTAPPGSPVDGRTYLIIATATGDWSGKENQLALRVGSSWKYVTPIEGTLAYVQDENAEYRYDGSAWGTIASGNPTESIIIACSDESTNITTGTAKATFRMPYAFTLSAVKASVTTAPTGSTIIIDINESGTTILSTKLSIDTTEKTSATAASAAVISDTALADDAEMTIDFDQVGSTIPGAGVKVYLIGTRT
jgi:hypothetical protein